MCSQLEDPLTGMKSLKLRRFARLAASAVHCLGNPSTDLARCLFVVWVCRVALGCGDGSLGGITAGRA